MRNLIFLIFSTFLFSIVSAQEQPRKISFQAEWQLHDEEKLPGVDRFIGNVIFKHENTIGYCDSAYHYLDENYLLAFGNPVRIHVNDSVRLYGEYLNYNSNTKISSIYRNVKLQDNTSALYCDSLIYDNNRSEAYYLTGGTMINADNTLTSNVGRYYTETNDVFLIDSVLLVNDTYTMNCQSLKYNTQNEFVYFISRTHLHSEENDIFTNSGHYDIRNDIALLVDSVQLLNEEQNFSGDSVFYDKNRNFGIGWNNVTIQDSTQGYIIKGNYAEHYENGGKSFVTDSTLLILIDQGDSLYLHSDTLSVIFDSLQEPQEMHAFHHVKIYREDIQGVCDSMSIIVEDSLLTMFYNPVLWYGANQLSGDTIHLSVIDSSNMTMDIRQNSFIIENVFGEKEFNQIKGVNIRGHILDSKLRQVDVMNNVECIYYVLEEDSSLIGINASITSEMRIFLKDNKLQEILFFNNPDGALYPYDKFPEEKRILKDFRWLDGYRPKKISDIFHTPIPRQWTEE